MSVYLYNLAFSLITSDTPVGRFQQYNSSLPNPTILNQSAAWFAYQLAGTPNSYGDYYSPVSTPLTPNQWGDPQPDTSPWNLEPDDDYLMMRVFCTDPNVSSYTARVTAVFGRGTSGVLNPGANDLQSPLVMSTPTTPSSYPRAVIDVDASSSSSWPLPLSDGSWVSWLGMIHAPSNLAANDYSCNVGVSVYDGSKLYTFGKDPQMHVVAGVLKRRGRVA